MLAPTGAAWARELHPSPPWAVQVEIKIRLPDRAAYEQVAAALAAAPGGKGRLDSHAQVAAVALAAPGWAVAVTAAAAATAAAARRL